MRIKFCCNALSVIILMPLGLKVRLTDADGKIIRSRSDGKRCDRGVIWHTIIWHMESEVGVMAALEASVDCQRPFDGNIRQE